MTLQMHSLVVDAPALERSMRMYEEHMRKGLLLLSQGAGDAQAICRHGVQFSIWNACILMILGRSDEEALRAFRQALAYGLMGLGAPGSKKGLRAYDVLMEIGEEGSRMIYEHERRSSREPRMISIGDYSSVLQMAVCFGDRKEIDEVARYPEERYRNPHVIAGADYYGYLQAWKTQLLGDDARAKREMQEALTEGPNAESRKDMEAFISLLAKDEQGFRTRAEERLNSHRKRYRKVPADPEGIICFPVLMLCRVAIDRGMVVEEWPYVPLKLLPNYKPVVH
jgi:hypothetical protein